MAKLKVTDFYIYRWRYQLGFAAITTLLISLMALSVFFTSPGLSDGEQHSAATSVATSFKTIIGSDPSTIINLPYHALQKTSIALFGLTQLSVKLPSLILVTLSVAGFYAVVRLWFRRNVATITSLLLLSSSLFLSIGQLGTPDSVYLFYGALLLFSTTMIAYAQRFRVFWFLASASLAAISLYTPLGLYPILALGITAAIHPHARFIVFRQSALTYTISGVLFLLITTPLIISIFKQPALLTSLLGIDYFSQISFESVKQTAAHYLRVYRPDGGILLTPLYHMAIIALAVLGSIRLFTANYTAKSYIMSITFVLLVIACLIQNVPASITLVPVMLLVAFGIDYLIRSWYRLFPRNPYARIAGLIPLAVLIIGIASSELERYTYSYRNLASSSEVYTSDLKLLSKELKTGILDQPTLLLVEPEDRDFYAILAKDTDNLTVITDRAATGTHKGIKTIITAPSLRSESQSPTTILTNSHTKDGARFYLYKNGF